MAEALIISLSSVTESLANDIADRMQWQAVHGNVIGNLQSAFRNRRAIVAVGACGIVIRGLSPLLADKHGEPPVLCVSPKKDVVVLLGGHHGGNALAEQVAEKIGGRAIISTASLLGEHLDNLGGEGWHKQGDTKTLMAKSAKGEAVRIYDPDNYNFLGYNFLPDSLVEKTDKQSADIIISDRTADIIADKVHVFPPVLVVGVGCERHADSAEVVAGIKNLLKENGLAEQSVAAVASIDIKCDEAALHAVACELQCGLRFFTAEQLHEYDAHLPNPSDIVMQEVGCRGVAEGAALAAFGGECAFVMEKRKFASFTCAIVRSKAGAELQGRQLGRLDIVGIGPGNPAYRTDSAVRALLEADVVVGYSLYLDLCSDLCGQAERLDYPLGAESQRCLKGLQLASEGRRVALVCSGDAGIYALGAVVYDVLAEQDSRTLNAVPIVSHPGISAFQLLAARVGAPFGDDFCLISLSDLWVDEAVIRKRIAAACEGDFAIAFYNPQSERRRSLLPFALKELQKHRKGDVAVIVGRQLGREEETIKINRLDEFSCDNVDMLSLVMVGNSKSRIVRVRGEDKVYSPRILSGKRELA